MCVGLDSALFSDKLTSEKSKLNPYKFINLPSYECTKERMEQVFNENFSFDPLELDGLLFYHKAVHYLPGHTPLVGWLLGFMVPELLGVKVGPEMLKKQPSNYATFQRYMEEKEEKKAEKKQAKMDT